MAPVTFNVTVTPVTAAGCSPTQVQMDYGDGSPTLLFSGSFTTQHSYSAGPHTAFVNVISPTGCKQLQIPFNVQCPPCCPSVSITPCIPDCDGNADRTVTFNITVTPAPAPCPPTPISFQMDFGDGTNGTSYTIPGTSSYSYSETHTYTGSSALQTNTAALQLSQPSQCAGTYSPQTIPACCTKSRAAWCATLFWIMSFSFAFALLFALYAILPGPACAPCLLFTAVPGYYTPLYFFYLFAIVGVIGLILYLLFCRKCRCDWVYFLLWRVLFAAGLLYFIFAACSLGIFSVLIGLVLMLIGILLLKKWQTDCCVTLCDLLKEAAWWLALIMAIATFLILHHISSGCVYTLFTIPIVVGFPPHVISFTITTYDVALAASTWFVGYVLHKC
jgi:hypothetical protein